MSTKAGTFLWQGTTVPFEAGDSLAVALVRAGIFDLGTGPSESRGRYFCGSGACQNCVVKVKGLGRVESCLTPAADGMEVTARGEDGDE